ncbi:hypothetical protein HNQ56_003741 [Anaerotaenia torta]|uniref:hypothetical protein n=1 Tax=Anaerotaenia torta TaxID=433293 RepID=UPI003D217190
MTNYADFTYYKDTYKGAVLDAASFDTYARSATLIIRQYTFNRVMDNNIPDDVKMCCCELAEYLSKKDAADHDTEAGVKGLIAETTGGHSASYETAEARERAHNNVVKGIIYNWLAFTDLLYRGC